MSKAISFGLLNLQTDKIITTEVDYSSAPTKNLQSESLASEHGGVYVQDLYRQKVILVRGVITDTDIDSFEQSLDDIQGLLNKSQSTLDIAHAGGTRRYIATVQNVGITRRQGMNSANFDIEFLCSDPFGKDTAATQLFNDNNTARSLSLNFSVEGSQSAQPLIVVTYSGVIFGIGKTVQISNGVDFTGVSVTRNWFTGDTLEVDAAQKTVIVNGSPVDFIGRFPEFDSGLATLQYVDNFGSGSYNIYGEYTKRYV